MEERPARAEATGAGLHWAHMRERGAGWGPMLLAYIYKLFGRTACLVILAPVVFVFFLTGAPQRRASQAYLARIWRVLGRPGKPNLWHSLRHFMAFGVALVDRFGAWVGDVDRQDIEHVDDPLFNAMRDDPRGALILSAHVGSVDVIRAIASRHQKRVVNVVMHVAHAAQFNRAVARFAPHSRVKLISAADFDMATAMSLSEAIGRGEWVVFMADRTPVKGAGRTITADFLGAPARWPAGPFVFARSVKCPTYVMVCYAKDGRRQVSFSQLADTAFFTSNDRRQVPKMLVESFVGILEAILGDAPYQWFNFYDFWAEGEASTPYAGNE